MKELSRKTCFCWVLLGGMKQKDLKATEGNTIIIATYAMASEGLDIKHLRTLLMATPKSDVEQSVGRILREEHTQALIIDIVDMHGIFRTVQLPNGVQGDRGQVSWPNPQRLRPLISATMTIITLLDWMLLLVSTIKQLPQPVSWGDLFHPMWSRPVGHKWGVGGEDAVVGVDGHAEEGGGVAPRGCHTAPLLGAEIGLVGGDGGQRVEEGVDGFAGEDAGGRRNGVVGRVLLACQPHLHNAHPIPTTMSTPMQQLVPRL